MLNSLDFMMLISLAAIAVCMGIIVSKFIYYFNSKKQIMEDQRNNARNIEILEAKLQEMKLKNMGHSLDENIKLISNDGDIAFSVDWGNIIG